MADKFDYLKYYDYQKEYRIKNKEKRNTQGKEYYVANKEARRAYLREYYIKNKDSILAKTKKYKATHRDEQLSYMSSYFRNKSRQRLYGITPEHYDYLFNKQNSLCLICSKPSTRKSGNLDVDHDHITKFIRGLLCNKCNKGLGFFGDNIETLKMAINYLGNSRKTEQWTKNTIQVV